MTDVRDYGAAGDGKADDTDVIRKAAASVKSGDTLRFPAGTYRVSLASADFNSVVAALKGLSDVRVVFEGGAKVTTADVFPLGPVGWCLFRFSDCDGCEIVDGAFAGVSEWETIDPATKLRATSRKGAVFCRLDTGCDDFRCRATVGGAAYAIYGGAGAGYQGLDGGDRYDLDLTCDDVGYPVALWGAGNGGSKVRIRASRIHRALYLAGVSGLKADVEFRDADAPVTCVVTGNPVGVDAKAATAEVGCRDIDIDATDLGSTHQPPAGSFVVGVGVSTDHGYGAHDGIRLAFRRTLGKASPGNLGGFQLFSGGATPAGNGNFEFRNVSIGGLLDRSQQPSKTAYRVGVIGDAGLPCAKMYGLRIADLEVRENAKDPAPQGIEWRTDNLGSPATYDRLAGMTAPILIAGTPKHPHQFSDCGPLNVVVSGSASIKAGAGAKLALTAGGAIR